jgi:hypothetical protein
MEDIKQKYLKYKKKYLQLKQTGGLYCHKSYTFGNEIGTCWYVSLLMILLFSDDYYTSRILNSFKDLEYAINYVVSDDELRRCLPDVYFNDNDYTKGLTDVARDMVFNFLNTIKTRFENKINENKIFIKDAIELGTSPQLIRNKSLLCEEDIDSIFKQLIITPIKEGGTYIESFFFMLFISIFLIHTKVSMILTKSVNDFLINEPGSIGAIMSYTGYETTGHDCAIYKCNGISFHYDSSKSERLIQYDYNQLFRKYLEYQRNGDTKVYIYITDLDEYLTDFSTLKYIDPILCDLYIHIKGPFIFNETRHELYAFIEDDFKIINKKAASDFLVNNPKCFMKLFGFKLLKQSKDPWDKYIQNHLRFYVSFYDRME